MTDGQKPPDGRMRPIILSPVCAGILLLLLSSGCTMLTPVEAPLEAGSFYVLKSEDKMVRFEFFPARPGQLHIVQTTQVEVPPEEILETGSDGAETPFNDSGGDATLQMSRIFYFMDQETGKITFCPDFPGDVGEHSRAYSPGLPKKGQLLPLGRIGDGSTPDETDFVCHGESVYEFNGREIPVIKIQGQLPDREDIIFYSKRTGIIVSASFKSGLTLDEFHLVDTNMFP